MDASFQLACTVDWGDSEPLLSERHVTTIVAAALYESGAEHEQIEVGVTFCDRERIAQLNAEHREVSGATDVLAFPIDGLLEPIHEGIPRQLGDIVICVAYVREQVAGGTTMLPHGPGQEQGDATVEAAVERCIVHGLLHLAGFDHERGELEAQEMFGLEQLVLDRIRSAASAGAGRPDA